MGQQTRVYQLKGSSPFLFMLIFNTFFLSDQNRNPDVKQVTLIGAKAETASIKEQKAQTICC